MGKTDKKKNGAIPNNGSVLHYLPINGVYTVPRGFHSGLGEVRQIVPILDAKTYTPSTNDLTIRAGVYLTGDQVIKGEPNLLPENILEGKSIFGVAGKVPVSKYKTCGYRFFGLVDNTTMHVQTDTTSDECFIISSLRFSFPISNAPIVKWNTKKVLNVISNPSTVDRPVIEHLIAHLSIRGPYDRPNWLMHVSDYGAITYCTEVNYDVIIISGSVCQGYKGLSFTCNGNNYTLAKKSSTSSVYYQPYIPKPLSNGDKLYLVEIEMEHVLPAGSGYKLNCLLNELIVDLDIVYLGE